MKATHLRNTAIAMTLLLTSVSFSSCSPETSSQLSHQNSQNGHIEEENDHPSSGQSVSTLGTQVTSPQNDAIPPIPTSSKDGEVFPPCQSAQLGVSLSAPQRSEESSSYRLIALNRTMNSCTITGFPGVSYLDSDGHQLGKPAERAGDNNHQPIALPPGGTAVALLVLTNTDLLQDCKPASVTQMRVIPPDQTEQIIIPAYQTDNRPLKVCSQKVSTTVRSFKNSATPF